jgi:uncharacterized protein with HEPN domain
MTKHTASPYLTDIVDAIARVRGLLSDMPLEAFKADWEKQWAIERGVEIISEASRRDIRVDVPPRRGRTPPSHRASGPRRVYM